MLFTPTTRFSTLGRAANALPFPFGPGFELGRAQVSCNAVDFFLQFSKGSRGSAFDLSRTLLVCSRSRPGVSNALSGSRSISKDRHSLPASQRCDRRSFRHGMVRPPIRLAAVDQCDGLRCVPFALTREFFKTEDNVLECLQICDFIERRGLKFRQQRLKSARVQ